MIKYINILINIPLTLLAAAATTGEPLNETNTSSARATLETVRDPFDVSNFGVIRGVLHTLGGLQEYAGVLKAEFERGGRR